MDIEAIAKVQLEPNDVLVLRCSRMLPPVAKHNIRETLTGIFGADRQIIILEDGMRLDVIAKEEAPCQR